MKGWPGPEGPVLSLRGPWEEQWAPFVICLRSFPRQALISPASRQCSLVLFWHRKGKPSVWSAVCAPAWFSGWPPVLLGEVTVQSVLCPAARAVPLVVPCPSGEPRLCECRPCPPRAGGCPGEDPLTCLRQLLSCKGSQKVSVP